MVSEMTKSLCGHCRGFRKWTIQTFPKDIQQRRRRDVLRGAECSTVGKRRLEKLGRRRLKDGCAGSGPSRILGTDVLVNDNDNENLRKQKLNGFR